ncbi:MAG: hypothetical protein KGH72_02215 [Candidatus Micrarchaeota archaeon]|nr:hypothetical protein [Candidatus Micrarchaeota archaeon]
MALIDALRDRGSALMSSVRGRSMIIGSSATLLAASMGAATGVMAHGNANQSNAGDSKVKVIKCVEDVHGKKKVVSMAVQLAQRTGGTLEGAKTSGKGNQTSEKERRDRSEDRQEKRAREKERRDRNEDRREHKKQKLPKCPPEPKAKTGPTGPTGATGATGPAVVVPAPGPAPVTTTTTSTSTTTTPLAIALAPLTASPSNTITQGQTVTVTGTPPTVGQGPYTPQFYETPPNFSNPILAVDCQNSQSFTCVFNTNSTTTTGPYTFTLSVTGGAGQTASASINVFVYPGLPSASGASASRISIRGSVQASG